MTELELITASLLLISSILGLASSWLNYRKEKIAMGIQSNSEGSSKDLKN